MRPMSARIGYFRVSTKDQSIESQRSALGGGFAKEFKDEGVSGAVLAADRPGFAALMAYAREGDTVCVYAVDRLGRDSIDIQQTVKTLLDRGVSVDVLGLGEIKGQAGKLILAVLSQIAEMEKARIRERCDAGRVTARAHLATTGKTHKGKVSLGRRVAGNAAEVSGWRTANKASIAKTAEHFKLSVATIKRYQADASLQKAVVNAA
jgi:putative DNA-invertase from lambdoid prophage Rac